MRAKTSAGTTQKKEVDERSSPGEFRDRATQMRGKEVGERPSQKEPGDLDDKRSEEDKSASTMTRGTPFFCGTSHKELRALINARDNQDIWAAMLEVEHPAQEWWEAYQALQKNQDPKQSVLMMLIYQQNIQWLKSRQISGLASKVMFASCREQYDEVQPVRQDALLDMPLGIQWPKLVICSANDDALDHNFALTVVQELRANYNTSAALICCAPDDGLPREKVASGQDGFLEELFYRTDLMCHAGQGCGGTLPIGYGGTVSLSGVSIFREGVSKGYQQCEAMQMHLVLAQHSHSSGGTHEVSNIGAQLRKSIAFALREARKEKNSAVVISGNLTSAQGDEILSTAAFAELLKEVLLEDVVQNLDEQFRCIFVAVQSPQQSDIYNCCFGKWSTKNSASTTTQVTSAETSSTAVATSVASDVAIDQDRRDEISGELVIFKPPQTDEVTLAKWLELPVLDDEDPWDEWSVTEAEGPDLPWQECPEAIMGHSAGLSTSMINKIGNELKDLARWMMRWDEMVEKDEKKTLWQRGQQGQCRQSNHVGVCYP
jgi:hypothetical protein